MERGIPGKDGERGWWIFGKITSNSLTRLKLSNRIPVVMHQEKHNVYVPELIYGYLLSGTRGGRIINEWRKPAHYDGVFITRYFAGSSFDDDSKKTTGGP